MYCRPMRAQSYVEEYSPMKRGLKGADGIWDNVAYHVEEYSPMKRGLKEADRSMDYDAEWQLKSIPR